MRCNLQPSGICMWLTIFGGLLTEEPAAIIDLTMQFQVA